MWRFYSNVRDLKQPYYQVGELHEGEHFGEHSCLLGYPRTSTTSTALGFSELYSLSRDDLMDVYRMWPELHKEFLELGACKQMFSSTFAHGPTHSLN